MKKIFTLFMCLILLCLPVLANYKAIPQSFSYKYQEEITQNINANYPKTIKEIEEISSKSHKMYLEVYTNKIYNNKDLSSKYFEQNFDIHIDTPEFNLYKNLLFITQKYAHLSDNDIPATDCAASLYEFLLPYFKDNNINTDKLDKINNLTIQKANQIEEEQTMLYKLFYP